MIFKVAICDDEENDIFLLKNHLQKIGAGLDIDFEITTYNDSRLLLSDYPLDELKNDEITKKREK